MASENPDFGTTLAQRLNHSRASAMLHSNLIAIKFGTAEHDVRTGPEKADQPADYRDLQGFSMVDISTTGTRVCAS